MNSSSDRNRLTRRALLQSATTTAGGLAIFPNLLSHAAAANPALSQPRLE